MNITIDEVAPILNRHRFRHKKHSKLNVMERMNFMSQQVIQLKIKYDEPLNADLPESGQYCDYIGHSYYIFGKTEWGNTQVVVNEKHITMTVKKNRYWRHYSDYDIVKLRCYMAIHGKVDGVIIEKFPEGSAMLERQNTFEWSDIEWCKIDRELNLIALELLAMTEIEVCDFVTRTLI